jgi:hypothetical protein
MSEINTTRTVGPKAAKKALVKAFKHKIPVFMWGPPGIGKSDLIKQIGADTDSHVIDVRLSLWDPTDIKGVPYFDDKTSTMKWAPPEELPSLWFADQFSRIILFLDEMNSAAPSVQAAAYQLVLNRRVGTYTLPDNVVIVAAGNREGDKGVTYKMPAPLSNRFTHLELTHSFDDWFEWATENKINKDVVGYLNWSKGDLYNFDPRTSSRAFATPRSWSFVSTLLSENDTDDATLMTLMAGSVGDGAATKFAGYQKLVGKMPNPSDILKGKVTKLDYKEISAMYSLTVGMCYELKDGCDRKDPDWNLQVNNFFQFMMDNFETELVVMGAKIALATYKLPLDINSIKCFMEFHKKYGKFIAAATGN